MFVGEYFWKSIDSSPANGDRVSNWSTEAELLRQNRRPDEQTAVRGEWTLDQNFQVASKNKRPVSLSDPFGMASINSARKYVTLSVNAS
jgi:hypothetical protein